MTPRKIPITEKCSHSEVFVTFTSKHGLSILQDTWRTSLDLPKEDPRSFDFQNGDLLECCACGASAIYRNGVVKFND